MDKLSSFSRVLLKIYSFAQHLVAKDFQDACLEAVQEILPFDSAMWGSATMSKSGIDIHTLARQMGTSVGMIEKHYSHLTPRMKKDVLTGKRYELTRAQYEAQLAEADRKSVV